MGSCIQVSSDQIVKYDLSLSASEKEAFVIQLSLQSTSSVLGNGCAARS